MAVTTPLMTVDDLLHLPDDGNRHELVRGDLRTMPPAGDFHGKVAMRVGWRLAQYIEANGLGNVYAAETGFVLATGPDTVRAPDVAFVRKERIDETGDLAGFRRGAPDLVVEVISPGDTQTEVEEKVTDWLQSGCRLVATLNPRTRKATVYRSLDEIRILTQDDTLELGEVVPGWSVPVKELFG